MKQVDSMPTEGQFVVVFEYNGNIWSCILVWEGGALYEHLGDYGLEVVEQDFDYTVPYYFLSDEHYNQKYFIFGE